jgi:hypothetical protein
LPAARLLLNRIAAPWAAHQKASGQKRQSKKSVGGRWARDIARPFTPPMGMVEPGMAAILIRLYRLL